MTPANKITELKTLLAEAKEALMNRDPGTRATECYNSGHSPCECTLCKINQALKEEQVVIEKGATEHSSRPTIEWVDIDKVKPNPANPRKVFTLNFTDDEPLCEDNAAFLKMLCESKPSDESFIETVNGKYYPYLQLYVPNDDVILSEAITELIAATEIAVEKASGLIWSDQRERIYKAIAKARTFVNKK